MASGTQPLAFVIFYAGLQTLPQDQMEAAQIDARPARVRGSAASMPLVTFVTPIQLMDTVVFEPIIGFNAEVYATSRLGRAQWSWRARSSARRPRPRSS